MNGAEPQVSSSVDYCWNRWTLRWCLKEHRVLFGVLRSVGRLYHTYAHTVMWPRYSVYTECSSFKVCPKVMTNRCLQNFPQALLSQRGHAMLRVCIASIQNVERSLLLLVVSTSDIQLRTIKFFSVLFSSVYSSMLQAVTNKHSLVRRRLCDLHCMVISNCFCHFVVRTSSNRSIRSIASGA